MYAAAWVGAIVPDVLPPLTVKLPLASPAQAGEPVAAAAMTQTTDRMSFSGRLPFPVAYLREEASRT